MKKLFVILGFTAAILALILSATPLSKIAFMPSGAALICGIVALFIKKGDSSSKKSIQLMFLMTIIALVVTTYKAVFNTVEVGDTEQLEQKEEELEEESLKDLEGMDFE
ncbi:FUSC family protein [Psychroserpens sp.]|uniref:FUSC family protein n=1 Tax=Psychroserpens sp. TaxID=2020870 RepID=UPI001B227CDC|nr:FUSC family protein [Psychroserpens sp.]MBO6607511.1 FUSC family protein [Psychroserpens sp.]MBO6632757.1 FUSC family protein [Psychroserpens sp.]MBO6654411.1 FUSC family protein [Psychroserpens sp.]MBO6681240.1 FUSC family protein [Psychroserpens sp.]MBO6749803.1 FUSC family protein [Psychroserpens sp.]